MTANHGSRAMAALVRELRRQGWRVEQRTHHWLAFPPDGDRPLLISSQEPKGGLWHTLRVRLRSYGITGW